MKGHYLQVLKYVRLVVATHSIEGLYVDMIEYNVLISLQMGFAVVAGCTGCISLLPLISDGASIHKSTNKLN